MSRNQLAQRSDGRFKVNYKNKQFYGKSKKEALRKRDEYVALERAGIDYDCCDTPFTEYGLRWLETYRVDCSSRQQQQYAGMIRYAGEKLNNKPMRRITVTDIQAVTNTLSVYSTSYVNKFLTTMRGIFRTAFAEGAILRNPMDLVKRPKCKKTEGHRALEEWERDLICSTYQEHDFGLVAMVMLFTGLRRGEAIFINVDRDVDFERNLITVRGAVTFTNGNQPEESEGKTENAKRTIPLVKPLADALRGHHGLLCTKEDGTLMSQTAFERKYESYMAFLGTRINGCPKRWYGRTRAHKALLAAGHELPLWKEVTIRCHDFRVDFCTRCYYADIPVVTLQHWMGHASLKMILEIYTKLSKAAEEKDATKLAAFMEKGLVPQVPEQEQSSFRAS
jgi:integrase